MNTRLKDKFVNQIDKIIWQYKLAPNTLNLSAKGKLLEIQVFDIYLKGKTIDQALLVVIDKAINHPIIFQIHQNRQIKVMAAYKRPSESIKDKWLVEAYFSSQWLDSALDKKPIPQAIDLAKLYEKILQSLMPAQVVHCQTTKSLTMQVAVAGQMNTLQKEITRLKIKYQKEKQTNRQFDINKQIKLKQKQLDNLTHSDKKH